ncbi:MAG: N-6 DNA methylase [Actinobacteria bacterium]|nr:N-6 DNA methylase [Actinomycetota bacterium]
MGAAFGTQFENTDELFCAHTYLVVVAELVAHSAIGFDTATLEPSVLLAGTKFIEAGVRGVVESDFSDWIVQAESDDERAAGERIVRSLARRVARFDWANVAHDVLKSLYESVITPEVRHSLGEYYTPDWLAGQIVREVVDEPASQRVLDPSCGSGTFLYQAIHHKLTSMADADASTRLATILSTVTGMDLHPSRSPWHASRICWPSGSCCMRDRPPVSGSRCSSATACSGAAATVPRPCSDRPAFGSVPRAPSWSLVRWCSPPPRSPIRTPSTRWSTTSSQRRPTGLVVRSAPRLAHSSSIGTTSTMTPLVTPSRMPTTSCATCTTNTSITFGATTSGTSLDRCGCRSSTRRAAWTTAWTCSWGTRRGCATTRCPTRCRRCSRSGATSWRCAPRASWRPTRTCPRCSWSTRSTCT